MSNNDIYAEMVDPNKIHSAASLSQEADRLKRIDDFKMQQQVNSPVYKKLSEQNNMLSQQCNDLREQNKLITQQLEYAKEESKKSKKLNIFMAIIALLSLIATIVSIVIALVN